MSARTRWALIGASTIAHEFMIDAIRAQPDAEIAGVFSSSVKRGARFAAVHEIPRVYETVEQCLQDPTVDAVYISTTNDLHAPHAIAAAEAGKHVLCDKPLATTLDDAHDMVGACERAGVVLATNHHLPNAATHRTIRRLIDDGVIGELRAVRVFHARALPVDLQTWRTQNATAGAGVILDVTVHDAALITFLLRERIRSVSAVAYRQGLGTTGIEDAVLGVMTTASGTPVSFHDAWTVPHAGTGLEVHGSEASIVAREVMTSLPVGDVAIRRGDAIEPVDMPDREDLYVRAVRQFQRAMRGEQPPAVSGREGVDALQVALAAAESAHTGRSIGVASLAAERAFAQIRLPEET
jgi:1,5-anhydro-D-fructose reductase (1,5-anhydro-D-mannitol-forming)